MPLRHIFTARWLPKPQAIPQHASSLSSAGAQGVLYRHPNLPGATSRTIATLNRPIPLPRSAHLHGKLPSRVRSKAPNPTFQRSSRRANSSSSKPDEPASFSQRMRKLSREYGWAALGVYLGLSALDFPFCFAAVRLLGVDRIGHIEHFVLESIKSVVPIGRGGTGTESESKGDDEEAQGQSAQAGRRGRGEEASLWTQLALAYAIHKSLIFFRVPLTAAVTPKVVKILRRWGWDIGKRKPKST